MKFELSSVSDRYSICWEDTKPCKCKVLEISTLEELLDYVKKEKSPVIITDYVFQEKHLKDVKWQLETYDGYRE